MTCDEDTLVIADKKKFCDGRHYGWYNICGKRSTKDILLESAWFNPGSSQVKQENMASKLTRRIVLREVSIQLQLIAIERATSLILEICGGMAGTVYEMISKEYLPKTKTIELNYEAVSKQLGIDLESKEIDEILLLLGLKKHKNSLWQVPSWRFDLEIQQD